MADPVPPLALRVSGVDHALEPGRDYLLGSAPECDLQLLGAGVGPRHARLRLAADGLWLEDLGCQSGTWRAGERVRRALVAAGDVLRLGEQTVAVVPDHGQAQLVPIPALRQAARDRRLAAVRIAAAARQHSATTFAGLMAEELRRAPWFAVSLLVHAVLLLLLWWLLPREPAGGPRPAEVHVHLGAEVGAGEAPPALPEIAAEPSPPPEPTAEPAPAPAPDPAPPAAAAPPPEPATVLRQNPRLTARDAAPRPGGAAGPGAAAADPLPGGGSEAFRRTVGQLRQSGLEIVFVFDSTGSMSRTIDATRQTLSEMLQVLRELVPDARIGLVTYRDRGPREQYHVRQMPLGHDFWRAANFVQFVSADGGGDFPEDVRAGLRAAFGQPWRPGARRVVVLAGDAPPHAADQRPLLDEVRAFCRDGRSFVHALLTSGRGATLGPAREAREAFQALAKAGRGACLDLEDHQRLLEQVLTLAFGREYAADVAAATAAVAAQGQRTDTASLDLARRGGAALRAALRRQPVPAELLHALARRARGEVLLQLVEDLADQATPGPTREAIAWVLQRALQLPVPPIDPQTSAAADRDLAEDLRRLVRQRRN